MESKNIVSLLELQKNKEKDEDIYGTAIAPYLKEAPDTIYTLVLDLDETLIHY